MFCIVLALPLRRINFIINVRKQAINDKFQRNSGYMFNIAYTYFTVNNQIKKGLLVSASENLKSVNIWQSY